MSWQLDASIAARPSQRCICIPLHVCNSGLTAKRGLLQDIPRPFLLHLNCLSLDAG